MADAGPSPGDAAFDEEETMTTTGTTGGTRAAPSGGRRAVTVALWALQALLALMFAMAGLAKVFGDPAMVDMFTTIGVGQWFRYAVGAIEVSGAIGVLIPRLSGPAALGLVRRGDAPHLPRRQVAGKARANGSVPVMDRSRAGAGNGNRQERGRSGRRTQR